MTLYNSIMELEKEIDYDSEDQLMLAVGKDIFMYQGYCSNVVHPEGNDRRTADGKKPTRTNILHWGDAKTTDGDSVLTYVQVEDGKNVGNNGEFRSFKPEVLKNTLTGAAIVDYNKIIKSVGIFTEEMKKSMEEDDG